MNYLRYHIASGIIYSKMVSEPRFAVEHDPDFALLEGEGTPDEHWIRDGEVAHRLPYTGHSAAPLVERGEDAVAVITGLPDPCWLKIRGTANMPFMEQLLKVEGGTFSFAPALAGRYVVILMGQHVAPERSFEAIDLAAYQARRNDETTARKAIAVTAGVEWNGHRWDTSPSAQLNLSGIASSINSGLSLPEDFYWTDFDNVDVPIDAAGVIALGQAVIGFNFAVHDHSRTLKSRIASAATLSEVAAIDIDTGWPS